MASLKTFILQIWVTWASKITIKNFQLCSIKIKGSHDPRDVTCNRSIVRTRKLSSVARQELESLLEDDTFSCGAAFSDLELLSVLSEVCARDLQCYDPVEKLYYSMNYNPICIYCCAEENQVTKDRYYSQCESCQDKVPVKKRV